MVGRGECNIWRRRHEGEEEEEGQEDQSRIDQRGDVVINGVEGVEEGVAPIDPSSIKKGGGRERGCRRREHDRTDQILR